MLRPTVDFTGLFQFVDFATRANNILDVLLADDEQVITSVAAGAPIIGDSDHLSITFKIVITLGKTHPAASNVATHRPTYKWGLADFDSMHHYLLCQHKVSNVSK